MSDATQVELDPNTKTARFDDRIDTETRISNRESAQIIGRGFRYISSAPRLFALKLGLSLLAIVPVLYLQWLGKILIDQVILQKPFDATDVVMPPHVQPFINLVYDYSPFEILVALTVVSVLLLLVFGTRTYVYQDWAQGEDSATQSENAMNEGSSESASFLGFIDTLIHIRLSQRLTNHIRTTLYRRMAHLPMTTLDDHRIGDAIYRVMYDAPMLPSVCYTLTLTPLVMIVQAVISIYFLYYSYGAISPELVWVAALLLPLGLCVTVPFSKLTRRVQQDSRAAGTATTNAIEESMGNIAAVQSLGGMTREKDRIDDQSKESFRRYRHIKIIDIVIRFSTWIVMVVVAFGVSVSITDSIIVGELSPGDWSILFGIWFSLAGAAMELGVFWIRLQGNAAALRRVFFFIDAPTEDTGQTIVSEGPQTIALEDASFNYPDGRPAFQNINLTLRQGELVAIVGPTGAGKTTLAYAIAGYVRPTRGRVRYDDTDLAEANVESVRDFVTYVFQEHMLLSESIRSNLLLVRPEATEADIETALSCAGAAEIVSNLPDGLDTVLGRSGDSLSVGQKQRVCIARGLIRDTPVLILDEPTAALDPSTEEALVESLQTASEDKLVLVIAHRLSTIRKADRIVFIDQGEVNDIGSHDELMSKEGSYYEFVRLQTGSRTADSSS